MSLTWNGDVLTAFDWSRVSILDRQFTKTKGIVDDDGSDIWLVEADGTKAILKRTRGFHRNVRVQAVVDELKPLFGLKKMGCVLIVPPAERPTLLMKFHGDGTNLRHLPKATWLYDRTIIVELVKMAILDLVIVNNNRHERNVLYLGPGDVLAIDEEKGLDFDGLVTFRMSHSVRMAMIGSDVDIAGHVAALLKCDLHREFTTLVTRYIGPAFAQTIAARMLHRFLQLPADYWRYLDSKYADGKRLGVKSKRQRGPLPWDEKDLPRSTVLG